RGCVSGVRGTFTISLPCPARLSVVVLGSPHGAPSVGQDVTLSVDVGLEPVRHFDWYRGRLADGSTRIFSYFPGQDRPQRNGVQFTGREVGFPNGSLLLRGARANDSGTYRVTLQLVPQGSEKGTVELRQNEPVPLTRSPARNRTQQGSYSYQGTINPVPSFQGSCSSPTRVWAGDLVPTQPHSQGSLPGAHRAAYGQCSGAESLHGRSLAVDHGASQGRRYH
uniref:Immunoglobulin domain-containing protein n=1 Tax=Chelydra serpentina TaxID=8475 RepID=A0A8C3T5Y4_CHESE